MKEFFFVLLIGIFFALPQNAFACSCANFPNTFCASVRDYHIIAKVRVLERFDYVHDNWSHPLISVLVEDHIWGDSPVADTFLMLGQDGFNCNEPLSFIADDELVVAFTNDQAWISTEAQEELGKPVVDLFGCGRFFLRVDGAMVNGSILPDMEAQAYESFRTNIHACVDFINHAPSRNSILAKAHFTLDGQLFLFTEHQETAKLQLFNAEGQLIRRMDAHLPGGGDAFHWTLPPLASGLYFVSLETASGRAVVSVLRS